MARIKGLTKDEASQEVRAIFEGQEKRYGFVSNSASVYALTPSIFKGVRALVEGIRASGLIEPELRHLICVKAANINGCPY
jgi:hypothetical protein